MSETTAPRWFGPKTLGWGWSPSAPQGWIVLGLFLFATWLSYRVLGRGLLGKLVRLKLLGLLFLVILATGDRPGSKLLEPRPRALDAAGVD